MSSDPYISNSSLPQQTSSSLTRIVKAQVALLLSHINKDNYKKTFFELNTVSCTIVYYFFAIGAKIRVERGSVYGEWGVCRIRLVERAEITR
ncbi:hypothetical protein BCR42DRAFT_428640 [Absidia repens]|uniref:Uncharacterized protein n=1 Tax=Absidia repens TaxID=90262 RepID=A0A1X2HY76_9FUNG|nr:hypothetical protein BCR42DRAFT_428640 [Absidia repens]